MFFGVPIDPFSRTENDVYEEGACGMFQYIYKRLRWVIRDQERESEA